MNDNYVDDLAVKSQSLEVLLAHLENHLVYALKQLDLVKAKMAQSE